jgi:mono/diheme cytochrome c family protein
MRFLFGIIIGVLLVPAALWTWVHYGSPPVAVTDAPVPKERMLTQAALHARIDRDMHKAVGAEANEATFVAGARIYRQQCAFCHGVSGSPSAVGQHMYPGAPPLWDKHRDGDVVGVSDDPAGETYWKVANGIRLTGMPGFRQVLSEKEMWQVSVLLANADKPLPPTALALLKEPLNFEPGILPLLKSIPATAPKPAQ